MKDCCVNKRIKRVEGGKRRDWLKPKSNLPIITIITSTYNAIEELPYTLQSLQQQTYPNLQWIVMDGASTDGTVELLKNSEDTIDYWCSESDLGIYDAWNKALQYVKGDWVQFLGAGDELYKSTTLEDVSKYLVDAHPKYDLVYGKVMYVSEKDRRELLVSGKAWKNYKNKWEGLRPELPVQTGIYHHKSIFLSKSDFNINYRITADCLFLLQHLKKEWLFLSFIVTVMPMGGISSNITSPILIFHETKKYMAELEYSAPFRHKLVVYFKIYIRLLLLKTMGQKRTKIFLSRYRDITQRYKKKNYVKKN